MRKRIIGRLAAGLGAVLAAMAVAATAEGPTLHLASGQDGASTNAASAFMYFVPLVSPEPVVSYSTDSAQTVEVGAAQWRLGENSFVATCPFKFVGAGSQSTVFDLGREIRRHQQLLSNGGQVSHLLHSILVQGDGTGQIEVEGTISNGVRTVGVVRLHFDSATSPVLIELCDIRRIEGQDRPAAEMVARVSSLTFRRAPGVPKMEVTIMSVKDKYAGDSVWQNFKGRVKGMAANLLIEPLEVEAEGHQAMLDFGRALITGAPTFTFPQARSLLHVH